MMLEIKSKRKSEMVVEKFINSILERKFKPGDRLPKETELANMFGVSRVTIREAFKSLSIMGLVDIRQGDGTYINTLSPESFMSPLLPMMMLSPRDIGDLYDARCAIECGAVKAAARNRTSADIERLEKCQESMKKYFQIYTRISQEKYAEADKEFHLSIINASSNVYYSKIFDAIYNILVSGIEKTSSTKEGREASLNEHARIIESIINQDEEQAVLVMYDHLTKAKNFYYSSLKLEND